jgi:hypothetical protein
VALLINLLTSSEEFMGSFLSMRDTLLAKYYFSFGVKYFSSKKFENTARK